MSFLIKNICNQIILLSTFRSEFSKSKSIVAMNSIKSCPDYIEKFKFDPTLIKKRSKVIDLHWKRQIILTFSFKLDFFYLLIYNFDLLIDNFDLILILWLKIHQNWLILIKNRSKLHQNHDPRLEFVVGFQIGPKLTIEFGIRIWIDDNESIWEP